MFCAQWEHSDEMVDGQFFKIRFYYGFSSCPRAHMQKRDKIQKGFSRLIAVRADVFGPQNWSQKLYTPVLTKS